MSDQSPSILEAIQQEQLILSLKLQKYLPSSMQESIKRKYVQNSLNKFQQSQSGKFMNSKDFKHLAYRILEQFKRRDLQVISDKMSFVCQSAEPEVLPMIPKDSMSCGGNVLIKEIVKYIFFNDKLCNNFNGIPSVKG